MALVPRDQFKEAQNWQDLQKMYLEMDGEYADPERLGRVLKDFMIAKEYEGRV